MLFISKDQSKPWFHWGSLIKNYKGIEYPKLYKLQSLQSLCYKVYVKWKKKKKKKYLLSNVY